MKNIQLKEWRLSKGYTQNKAASVLYVSLQHYRKWETGKAAIPYLIESFISLI